MLKGTVYVMSLEPATMSSVDNVIRIVMIDIILLVGHCYSIGSQLWYICCNY